MGCGIDTAGETGGDDKAFHAEIGGDETGEFLSHRRGIAGTDDGDDGIVGEFESAFDVDERRWGLDTR